jgi:hypothetical protein
MSRRLASLHTGLSRCFRVDPFQRLRGLYPDEIIRIVQRGDQCGGGVLSGGADADEGRGRPSADLRVLAPEGLDERRDRGAPINPSVAAARSWSSAKPGGSISR